MRLTCPKCGAEYEIPDAMIPPTGRDVECSNCGEIWFAAGSAPETAPESEPEPAFEPEPVADAEPAPVPAPSPLPQVASKPQPDAQTDPEFEARLREAITASLHGWTPPDAAEAADTSEPADDQPEPTPLNVDQAAEADRFETTPTAPPAREIDPQVSAILREEAARETAARRADTAPLESQPDLGPLDPAAPQPAAPEPAPIEPAAPTPQPRRDLLPRIEDVATPADTASERDTGAKAGRRRGFGWGFVLALCAAGLATGAYLGADQIAEAQPSLAEPLNSYTSWVDTLRASLQAQAAALLAPPQ